MWHYKMACGATRIGRVATQKLGVWQYVESACGKPSHWLEVQMNVRVVPHAHFKRCHKVVRILSTGVWRIAIASAGIGFLSASSTLLSVTQWKMITNITLGNVHTCLSLSDLKEATASRHF